MAGVVAGAKRSYHQMRGDLTDQQSKRSGSRSREESPLAPHSRASQSSNGAPNALIADSKIYATNASPRNATFDPSASIVLIGVRGVGKSTLGVLAATAYNRQVVDSERAFLETTGSTSTAFRKLNGTKTYRTRHREVLEKLLQTYSNGSIIICSFYDLENDGSALLRSYAQSHPVIHITRDAEGIQSYLQVWNINRINELLSASCPILRACSNYEFFNLSEESNDETSLTPIQPGSQRTDSQRSGGSFLTLKRVERDFLRLLRNIIGDHNRGPSHQSAYPLSKINIEDRPFTLVATAKVSEIVDSHLDFDTLQTGADCLEIINDLDNVDEQKVLSGLSLAFAKARRATILPILLTASCMKAAHNPTKALPATVDHCLQLGPELCTMDVALEDSHLRKLLSSKGSCKIIGSAEMPDRLENGWKDQKCIDLYRKAAEIGCEVFKITMPAKNVEDTFAILAFQDTIDDLGLAPKLIAYNTGARGRTSKCFNRVMTPVKSNNRGLRKSTLTHTAQNSMVYGDRCSSPNQRYRRRKDADKQSVNEAGKGEDYCDAEDEDRSDEDSVSAKAITQARFTSFIHQPLRFFIYGADVGYSLSPIMHNAAYQACGMPHTYGTYSSPDLDSLRKLVKDINFGGAAVTQPFKTTAVSLMDGLSSHARAIGAINTIVPIRELLTNGNLPSELSMIISRNQQGPIKALYGFNTDWIGIRACIRRGLSPANTVRPQSSALVCGAGGMARSAVYSLISLGVRNIFICNRTVSNANALADHYNKLVGAGELVELDPNSAETRVRVLNSFNVSWPSDVRQPTMIVCCIPRQTDQNTATNFCLPTAWLQSPTGGVVVEVAYKQPVSPIVRQVEKLAPSGWIFLDGFDVLPEQAFSQFELFTGRRAPRKLMRDEIFKQHPASTV